jgi:nitrile hydratase accessory protein
MSAVDRTIADAGGVAVPPRQNGELLFDAPWESRAFGIALALHDGRILDYEEFRTRLIEEIAGWEGQHGTDGSGYRYYERWAAALERALTETAIVSPVDVDRRSAQISDDRAHDHDHDHGHSHHHEH